MKVIKTHTFKIFDIKISVLNLHRLSGKKENEASDCFAPAALAKGVQGKCATNECPLWNSYTGGTVLEITEVLLN